MIGVGKTSLSKNVCSRDDVNMLFEQVISVTVSYDYDLSVTLKRIAEEVITEESLKTEGSNGIIRKLTKVLKNKKYLLRLDDVWHTFDWRAFKRALDEIGGSKGTTILVTSRRRDAVEKLQTTDGVLDIHELKNLTEDYSWSLFMDRMSDDVVFSDKKEELARRMVESCKGLPLAIKLLGDLLRNNNSLQKWEEFYNSEEWKRNDENDILLPSLHLSYKYLKSSTLKTCFSYCAIFGEDEVIDKHRLIHLWMAHGFLQQRPFVEMEDVGEECFNELLNSSLFHEPVFDRLRNVKSVKMHDLVRDLACDISAEEIRCYNKKAHTSGSGSIGASVTGVRHLSVPQSDSGCNFQVQGCKMIRTCVFKAKMVDLGFLKEYKNLRALSVRLGTDTKISGDDWVALGQLTHLRFLEIMVDEKATVKFIKKMEGQILLQIAKLYHLQTLYISTEFIFQDDLPTSMPDFPKEFGNLVNLRHIVSPYRPINVYEGLGFLSSLQTLPTIKLEKKQKPPQKLSLIKKKKRRVSENIEADGKISDDLKKLERLRGTLEIDNLECVKSQQEAEALGLGNKSRLTTLSLSGFGASQCEDVIIEALKPHDSLIDLKICGFGGTKLPTWLTDSYSLSNLASLRLQDFEEVEGNLNLGMLKSLRILKLKFCWELVVTAPGNDFKCCKLLEKLTIFECDRIDSIPDLSSLSRLRSLKVLGGSITTLACSTLSLTKLTTYASLLPESLSEDDPICKSLTTLILRDKNAVEDLPEQIRHFKALQHLKILSFEKLKTLPEWLGDMKSINYIHLFNLPKLECLPSKAAIDGLSNLARLNICLCPTLSAELAKSTRNAPPQIQFGDLFSY